MNYPNKLIESYYLFEKEYINPKIYTKIMAIIKKSNLNCSIGFNDYSIFIQLLDKFKDIDNIVPIMLEIDKIISKTEKIRIFKEERRVEFILINDEEDIDNNNDS